MGLWSARGSPAPPSRGRRWRRSRRSERCASHPRGATSPPGGNASRHQASDPPPPTARRDRASSIRAVAVPSCNQRLSVSFIPRSLRMWNSAMVFPPVFRSRRTLPVARARLTGRVGRCHIEHGVVLLPDGNTVCTGITHGWQSNGLHCPAICLRDRECARESGRLRNGRTFRRQPAAWSRSIGPGLSGEVGRTRFAALTGHGALGRTL